MTKENLFSLLRNLLTIAGGWLIGKAILGTTLDPATWEGWVGAIIAIGGIVWGILDKSLGIEALQSSIRHIVSVIGGILIATGKLTTEKLETWLGVITVLIPIIYGYLSKSKSTQIKTGEIPITLLKSEKVEPVKENFYKGNK